jgi:hypothetical protein
MEYKDFISRTKNKSSSTSSYSSGGSNDHILIDITVANCNILAAKPTAQFQNDPMPINELEKIIWWENINANRLNNRGIFYFIDSGAFWRSINILSWTTEYLSQYA